MKSLLPLFLLAATPTTGAVAISGYIQALTPQIGEHRADRLGRLIYEASTHADIDPFLLAAIVRKESTFRSGLKVCYIRHAQNACFATCDLGISQINQSWVSRWHLDEDLLRYDDGYNLRVASRILSNIKRDYGDEETYWSRYNSSTDSSRVRYEAGVESYLALADRT